MKHFGGIANVGRSHIYAMCAIGHQLQERGHRFTFFGTASQVKDAAKFGILCVILGPEDPPEEAYRRIEQGGNLSLALLSYTEKMAAFLCSRAPQALQKEQIDYLLADQEEPGASTAADLARVPYITICNSIPFNKEFWGPPRLMSWGVPSPVWVKAKDKFYDVLFNVIARRIIRLVNVYRRSGGLKEYRKRDDSLSTIAEISQLVREFNPPQLTEIPALHYVGPFQRQIRQPISFPFERLNGRPLIYVSFGTTKSDQTDQFCKIAQACATLPVQLVISLGGARLTEAHEQFPGNPIVVQYAPQLDILARASIAITHAGLNSVMEALNAGVPLIAFPLAGDQWSMASRIAYHKVGTVLQTRSWKPVELRDAINRILNDPRYRLSVRRIQEAISATGGAAQAAEIIETISRSFLPGNGVSPTASWRLLH